jgi:two-component system, chemotaxis family, chemotaxis protein CheY
MTAVPPDSRALAALIVDDEADIRLLLRMAIERYHRGVFSFAEAEDGHGALAQIEQAKPAVVILDQMMPGMDGLETAAMILQRRPGQPIVLCSSYLYDDLVGEALQIGIRECIDKRDVKLLADAVHRLATTTT